MQHYMFACTRQPWRAVRHVAQHEVVMFQRSMPSCRRIRHHAAGTFLLDSARPAIDGRHTKASGHTKAAADAELHWPLTGAPMTVSRASLENGYGQQAYELDSATGKSQEVGSYCRYTHAHGKVESRQRRRRWPFTARRMSVGDMPPNAGFHAAF